jgi:hypothetical protein
MDERGLGRQPCPKDSLTAAGYLGEALASDNWDRVEELLGATDCPYGCYVEPDGRCRHGWCSAALSVGVI